MEFFEGFRWAVPKAFSDAVGLCRFEEGDVLYDAKNVYREDCEWKDVAGDVEQSLQVKFPARAISGTGEKFGDVFNSNWDSEVRLDLYKGMEKTSAGQVETTQGRLYTMLWKGDLSVLDMNTENPPVPLVTRKVTKLLNEARNTTEKQFFPYKVFVMARDSSNQVSRDKYRKVNAILDSHLGHEVVLMSPEEAGLKEWQSIVPTIVIVFFVINHLDEDQITELVKKAVYVPSKTAKNPKFRLSAHGIIFAPSAP